MEAVTKYINDYLDRKVYTNYFVDILWTNSNDFSHRVLNIIYVDKSARRVHQTKFKPKLDQNQQIQREIYLHRKNNHYSAMAAQKENHIYSKWLKNEMRSHIRKNTDANQIPIKTNKRSDHCGTLPHVTSLSLTRFRPLRHPISYTFPLS